LHTCKIKTHFPFVLACVSARVQNPDINTSYGIAELKILCSDLSLFLYLVVSRLEMDPAQVLFFERLAETIRQTILLDLASEFGIVHQQCQAGADEVTQLRSQLAELAARVDSAKRAYRVRHEARSGDLDEEESELTASARSAQAALDKEFDERLEQDTSPAYPSSHLKPQYLDVKYIKSLTSSLPVFASAGRVSDAKMWLDAARTSRDTLECSAQPMPEADRLFAHHLATRLKDGPQQRYRTSF
jgi:hypothetical protein